MRTIKEMRIETGLSQVKFGNRFHISPINIANWEQGVSTPPEYVPYLIDRVLKLEDQLEKKDSKIANLIRKYLTNS